MMASGNQVALFEPSPRGCIDFGRRGELSDVSITDSRDYSDFASFNQMPDAILTGALRSISRAWSKDSDSLSFALT